MGCVIGLAPGRSIVLQGLLSPAFGGPAHTLLEIRLETSGNNTLLKLSDTIFGKVGDDKLSQTKAVGACCSMTVYESLWRRGERKNARHANGRRAWRLGIGSL